MSQNHKFAINNDQRISIQKRIETSAINNLFEG